MKTRAQSEMVGFAIILIIVAVLIIVFLSISLNDSSEDIIESSETETFIQSMLDYTTECKYNYKEDYYSVLGLIKKCDKRENCFGNLDSCVILNDTLEDLIGKSWRVGADWPTKGYFFELSSRGTVLVSFEEGNITTNQNRGSVQNFSEIDLMFVAYY